MTSSTHPKVPEHVIVLGMHVDDTLNVFVRDAQHNLHQAARISTRNGVDPLSMTAIMADLADSFGWRQIVATPEGPHLSRELPRGTRPAVNSATGAAGREPKTKMKRGGQPGKRRGAREMLQQNDTIVAYLDQFTAPNAVTTGDVRRHVATALGLKATNIDSNVRHNLDALFKAGTIGCIIDPTVTSGGRPSHRWYGLPADAKTAVWTDAIASVNLDGDTMS